ncbi:hypothetical protein EDB81DRAFT_28870 [Dactylonectria macrodidyma]|uniref:AB hydrolase-1 domain-containing protein n=1 Tax=Dactylonectria macrodidyma TaxID=307937 RepID=A0A9P9JMQ4_9HYPO|nr:hypothetical protein EDB81DRAFT_28870 [Dactylonectria macrodidyma]
MFQVSGLARSDSSNSEAGHKSERTIVLEPGGPGGSGTSYVWEAAEQVTGRLNNGQFDVFGWDPRGVNTSLPSMSCYSNDAFRDRWSLLTRKYREESNPLDQLYISDAMNNATFHTCHERLGDFGRFINTASVARDLRNCFACLTTSPRT